MIDPLYPDDEEDDYTGPTRREWDFCRAGECPVHGVQSLVPGDCGADVWHCLPCVLAASGSDLDELLFLAGCHPFVAAHLKNVEEKPLPPAGDKLSVNAWTSLPPAVSIVEGAKTLGENPYVLALLSAARDYGRVQAATGPSRAAFERASVTFIDDQAVLARTWDRFYAKEHNTAQDHMDIARCEANFDASIARVDAALKAYSDVEQQYNDAERALNAAAIALYAAEEA